MMLKNQTDLVKLYQYKSMHILAHAIIKQYIMMNYAQLIIHFDPLNMCGSGISFNDMLICQSEGFRDERGYTQWLHEHATSNSLDNQSITGPSTGLTSRNQVYEHVKQGKQI